MSSKQTPDTGPIESRKGCARVILESLEARLLLDGLTDDQLLTIVPEQPELGKPLPVVFACRHTSELDEGTRPRLNYADVGLGSGAVRVYMYDSSGMDRLSDRTYQSIEFNASPTDPYFHVPDAAQWWYTVGYIRASDYAPYLVNGGLDIKVIFYHRPPNWPVDALETIDTHVQFVGPRPTWSGDGWGFYAGDTHFHSAFTDNDYENGSPLMVDGILGEANGVDWFTYTDHSYELDAQESINPEAEPYGDPDVLMNPTNYEDSPSQVTWLDSPADPYARGAVYSALPIKGEEMSVDAEYSGSLIASFRQQHMLVYGFGPGDTFIPSAEMDNIPVNDNSPADLRDMNVILDDLAARSDALQPTFAYAAHPATYVPEQYVIDNFDFGHTGQIIQFFWAERWTADMAADTYQTQRDPVNGQNLLRGFEFWNTWSDRETPDGLVHSGRNAALGMWENALQRIMLPSAGPAMQYHWYLTGGSDNHGGKDIGVVKTVVCSRDSSRAEVLDALYYGRAIVTDGPYFSMGLDLNGDGDTTDFAPLVAGNRANIDGMMGDSVVLDGPNHAELKFDWPSQSGTDWGDIASRGTIALYHYDSEGSRIATYSVDAATRTFDAYGHRQPGWNCFRAELVIPSVDDPTSYYKAYTNPIWIYFEPSPGVSIQASDPSASEVGPNPGTFTITRTGRTNTALDVEFQVDGTATSGTDYALLGTHVIIPIGASSVGLTVSPVVDYLDEGTETVYVALAGSPNYTRVYGNATMSILDAAPPDLAVTKFIVSSAHAALSSGNTAHIRIENLGDMPAPGQYEVELRLSDDSVIDASDRLLDKLYFNSGMSGHQVFEDVDLALNLPGQDPFLTDNEYWVGTIIVPKSGAFDLNAANNSNVGHETDKDDISSEKHLHSPLDGAVDAERIAAGLPFTVAQTISAALGDEWIGDWDIDTYQFHANQRQRFGFDIDVPVYLASSYLRLYDSAWNLLAENGYGAAPDDTAPYYSYLQYTFETAGDYFLAVSSGNNETADPRNWLNRQRGGSGAYTLTVSNIVQADLMATVMTASPDRVPSDGRTGVDITLRNDGTADAGGFSVQVWMDDTRVINLNPAFRQGQLVGAAWAAGLAKNTSTTIHLDLNLPCPAPSSYSNRYWLSALVDADGQVTEYNETNNANRAEHADSDAVSAEDHVPCPADDVHVRADPIAPGQTVSAVIGDEWIGAEDLDTYVFTASAGQTLGFDVDSTGGTIDPYLWLFSASGQMLARNDQEAAPGETVADAYLEYTFAAAGEYWVCVAGRGSTNLTPWDTDPRQLGIRSYLDAGTLDYDLTVTALAGPSSLGPRVVSVRCVYNMYLEVVFTEPVSRWTFTDQDVAVTGPSGALPAATMVASPEILQSPLAMGYRTWSVAWMHINPDNSVTWLPLPAGTYTVTVGPDVADMAGNLMDQDGDRTYGEGDDAYTGQFTVGAAQEYAELSVRSVTGPAFAALDQPASVTVVVANTGSAPSAACNLDLYLSGDTAWGADRKVATVAVAPIAAGRTATVELAADLAAAGTPTGDYYWLAYVDPGGLSGEGNANDNWLVGGAVRVVEELRPNLTGAIGAVNLPAWVVPGDKGTVQVIVHNGGSSAAVGTVRVNLFASANRFLDPLDAPLASQAGGRLNLAPGKDATIPVKVVAPDGMPDGYYVLAVIDAGNVVAESDETDNLAVSDATGRAGWRFGTFEGRKNVKLTVHDALDQAVTFTLSGGGYGVVSGGNAFTRIDLLETGEKSALKIATTKGARLLIGGLTADGPLKSIDARTTDLQGRIDLAAGVASLAMGDFTNSEILLDTGPGAVGSQLQATLTLGRLTECRLAAGDVPIKSLTAVQWLDDDNTDDLLTARWLGTLSVTGRKGNARTGIDLSGDFEADVVLTDAAPPKGVSLSTFKAAGAINGTWTLAGGAGTITVNSSLPTWEATFGPQGHRADITKIAATAGNLSGALTAGSIGTLSVKGWIDHGSILASGVIKAVMAGGLRNSSIFAGVVAVRDEDGANGQGDTVLDLPLAADLSADTLASIQTLTISGIKADSGKGYQDSFINSNIAAPLLGTISLAYAHLDADGVIDNGGVPFGLTGKTLTKLTYKDAIHKYPWKAGQALPPWPDINDLKLRLG